MLAAVAFEMSVAQMLKLHSNFTKESVASAAGLMTTFFSFAYECCYGTKCLNVFLL